MISRFSISLRRERNDWSSGEASVPAGEPAEPEDQAFLSRLKEMEKREIMAALERHHWIQSQAAMDLGLTLRQIGYRVKQFGLERLIKEQRGLNLGGKLKSLAHRP